MSAPFPEVPRRRRSLLEVRRPNFGLYLDRDPLDIPDRGLQEGNNFRIRDGRLTNINCGYKEFYDTSLGEPITLIDAFVDSGGSTTTIIGTKSWLFRWDEAGSQPYYLNPVYETGQAAASGTTVTGTGTAWLTNAKEGDRIRLTLNDYSFFSGTAYGTVTAVNSDTELEIDQAITIGSPPATDYVIFQSYTGTDSSWWDTTDFPAAPTGTESGLTPGDRWVATNGNEVVIWDGDVDQAVTLATATTGLAFTCKTVTYYKNMLLFGNVLESGTSNPDIVKNTAIGDPENITTLEAGTFLGTDGIDFIEAIVPLGDFVVIYAENSVNIAQFVGAPLNFAVRTVAPGIGMLGPKTYLDFGDYHQFLSIGQAYRFDGVRLAPFGGQVFPELLRRLDAKRTTKAFAAISEEDLEVYWLLPSASDGADDFSTVKTCYTQHYAENVGNNPDAFSKRDVDAGAIGFYLKTGNLGRFSDYDATDYPGGFMDLAFRFNDRFFTDTFPVLLMGGEDGKIYEMNTTTSIPNTTEMNSFVITPQRPVGEADGKGILRRVGPALDWEGGADWSMTVLPRSYERPGAPAVLGTSRAIALDQSNQRYTNHRFAGRYMDILFGTQLGGQIWRMSGYQVVIDAAGER